MWSGGVSCISFDRSGEYLASAGGDGSLIFYTVNDPLAQPAAALEGKTERVSAHEYEACGECHKQDDINEELYLRNALGEGQTASDESK